MVKEHDSERRATAEVLLAASLWGCIGLFTRYLSALGMSALAIAFFRSLAAALMLAGYLGVRAPEVFRIRLRDLWMFVGTGFVSIGCFNVFYFMTQTFTTLSVSAVLLYTAPFFVIFMSRLFFKEAITRQKIVAVLLAFAGCLFATGLIGAGDAHLAPVAIFTGMMSAICYALYSIFGQVALARYAPLTVTFYSLFISACSMGIVFAASGAEMPAPSGGMLLGVLGLGLFSTALPYIFYTRGLAGLSPSKASVLAFAEPMVATLVGIVILHEPITVPAVIGIALIFSGILVLNRRTNK